MTSGSPSPTDDAARHVDGEADAAAGAMVVDARGLICPAPVIALAKAARTLPEGSRVTVLATDPAAAVDVPAWARMRGHRVLETTEDGEHLALTVLLGPVQAVGRPDGKVS